MAPRIHFGVNLSFAKYVYGRKRALEIVRRKLGLRSTEMVGDNDFGAVFYLQSPEAFREYHYEIADHAESEGVRIAGVFTVYRETGAIADSHRDIRESSYTVGLSLIEQATCYGASYVGAALFTMNKEAAEDPERYQAQFDEALGCWKRWMGDAKRLGVARLLIETAAAYREGCSTIHDTRAALQMLTEFHDKNPDTTAPVGLCYDTGHGVSPTENRDDANRDFREWLNAFSSDIHSIHLKNTDPEFIETWHLDREEGIIRPREFLEAVRDSLTVPEVYVQLEVPGKRGRDIGEERAISDHLKSIDIVGESLRSLGYTENADDGSWDPPA
ncbi:MAG: TIM barrel protein [Planctomycetota bacterium]|nr:TIM barrel protein [Planctomycetota bacterium]